MRIVAALFVLVWCGAALSASAQQAPQAGAPDAKGASPGGTPQQATQAKAPAQPAKPGVDLKLIILIRTALIALNQANLTGNYSVLRDIAAPSSSRPTTLRGSARSSPICASAKSISAQSP
ncbi:MAG: hypothetical protein JJE37_13355 [Methyloceanibacter sp.]|nr:hypothetical protein [Methyloceanibacter sp.]